MAQLSHMGFQDGTTQLGLDTFQAVRMAYGPDFFTEAGAVSEELITNREQLLEQVTLAIRLLGNTKHHDTRREHTDASLRNLANAVTAAISNLNLYQT